MPRNKKDVDEYKEELYETLQDLLPILEKEIREGDIILKIRPDGKITYKKVGVVEEDNKLRKELQKYNYLINRISVKEENPEPFITKVRSLFQKLVLLNKVNGNKNKSVKFSKAFNTDSYFFDKPNLELSEIFERPLPNIIVMVVSPVVFYFFYVYMMPFIYNIILWVVATMFGLSDETIRMLSEGFNTGPSDLAQYAPNIYSVMNIVNTIYNMITIFFFLIIGYFIFSRIVSLLKEEKVFVRRLKVKVK